MLGRSVISNSAVKRRKLIIASCRCLWQKGVNSGRLNAEAESDYIRSLQLILNNRKRACKRHRQWCQMSTDDGTNSGGMQLNGRLNSRTLALFHQFVRVLACRFDT